MIRDQLHFESEQYAPGFQHYFFSDRFRQSRHRWRFRAKRANGARLRHSPELHDSAAVLSPHTIYHRCRHRRSTDHSPLFLKTSEFDAQRPSIPVPGCRRTSQSKCVLQHPATNRFFAIQTTSANFAPSTFDRGTVRRARLGHEIRFSCFNLLPVECKQALALVAGVNGRLAYARSFRHRVDGRAVEFPFHEQGLCNVEQTGVAAASSRVGRTLDFLHRSRGECVLMVAAVSLITNFPCRFGG